MENETSPRALAEAAEARRLADTMDPDDLMTRLGLLSLGGAVTREELNTIAAAAAARVWAGHKSNAPRKLTNG